MSETIHIHALPVDFKTPMYSVHACACGERFYVAPKGILGYQWLPVAENKTEDENGNIITPEVPDAE